MVEEFEKEYQRDIEDIRRQKKEERTFRREELPKRFTVKKLFRQLNKRYNKDYWGKLERNWKQQKEKQRNKKKALKTIREGKKEIKQKKSEIRE